MPHAEPLSGRYEPGEGPEAVAHDAAHRPLEWAHFFVERLTAHERAFERMEKSFIGFRVWVTTVLGLAGAVIGIAGWGIISSAWSLQRDLGKMEANLSSYTASMDRLEKSNEKLGDKIDHLSEIINRMQGRLDRDAAPATKGAE
jgi:cell division protein FtsB